MPNRPRSRHGEHPEFGWRHACYVAFFLAFLFLSAWATSDSIVHGLLAVAFFVGIILVAVLHQLRVRKQRFLDSMAEPPSPFDDDLDEDDVDRLPSSDNITSKG